MPCSRHVLRLLEYAESRGIGEEVVGDLLEEIAGGRSCGWIYRQLVALVGLALIGHVRDRVRVTPPGVAMALSAVMLAGASLVPLGRVLEAWLVLYCVTGTLSLFAHMASKGVRR